jgi:hypothetical protein
VTTNQGGAGTGGEEPVRRSGKQLNKKEILIKITDYIERIYMVSLLV